MSLDVDGGFDIANVAAAAAVREQLARLRRGTWRVVPEWHDFQELTLTRNRLWADLRTQCERRNRPLSHFEPRERALYSFVITNGIPRMGRRPPIGGAAKSEAIEAWTEAMPEGGVLHVEGEIDLATAPQFSRAIAAALRKHDVIIVDLTKLRYLDGAGIKVLFEAAEAGGRRLVVVGSSPVIHRVLDILRVGDVVPTVPTLEAARQYLRKR